MMMTLPLQMRVEGCRKEVAHGDAGVRYWGEMRGAGFGGAAHSRKCLIPRLTGV